MFKDQLISVFVAFLFFATCLAAPANNNRQTSPIQRVREDITSLQNLNWQTRKDGFYDLLRLGGASQNQTDVVVAKLLKDVPQERDAIKLSLIGLLVLENSTVREANRIHYISGITLTEAYANYYGDVIWAVSVLEDVRAIDALLGAINTGHMATAAIARFGKHAVDQTIGILANDQDPDTRQSAAMVASEMLDPDNVKSIDDPISKNKLKQAILTAVRDEDPDVRIIAVAGLAKLGDRGVVYVLEALARGDSYEASQHGGASGLYPVREAAKNALTQLGN